MKKRKVMALVLAATLAMTSAGEAASVLAADFTDVEVFTEEEPEPVAEAGISETEPETVAAAMEEEPPVQEEADEAELFEDAAGEEDLFSAGVPEEEFADGTEEVELAAQDAKAVYRGMFLSQDEFAHWKQTGDAATDREWEGPDEECSFTDFLNGLSKKTGYVLVRAEDGSQSGYADMVIPEGLTVVVGNGCDINIKSITPNGDIYIYENVNTPGTLEIKEGKGSVTVKDCPIDGAIVGSGTNDTLIFDGAPDGGWNHIGGLQGVENVIFSETRNSLEIERGAVEFYNITNLCKEGEEDKNIYLNFQGYDKNNVPVFHKDFNLGKCHGINDQGELEEWEAGIGVHYIENFDVPDGEDWKFIDIGEGNPAVKFAADDAEAMSMASKMWVGGIEPGYGIDIDGTVVSYKEDRKVFGLERFQAFDEVSAEEAFNSEYRQEYPGECRENLGDSNTLANILRKINADQKSGDGQGYYYVTLPRDYKSTETLTVPSSVTGIIYKSDGNYDEKADIYTPYPVQVSSVNVPAGKIVRLIEFIGSTGTLNITGSGTADLTRCRLNQDVTAGNLIIDGTTVKSLVCDKLYSERTWLAVEKYLKFNEASLLSTDVLAKSGAYLNLGKINNAGTNMGDIAINLEVNNGKAPEVYFAKSFDLGSLEWDGEIFDAVLDYRYYDYAKVAAVNANSARNLYDIDFDYWDEEGKNPHELLVAFGNKAESLMTFSKEATEDIEYMLTHMNISFDNTYLFGMLEEADPAKVPLYVGYEDKEPTATKSYVTVNGGTAKESLVSATVSSIKNQTYTGKALKPAVTVKLNGKTLKSGTDYTVAYKNNTKVGTATVTITGKGNYTGTLTQTFKIVYAVPAKGKTYTVGALKYIVTKSSATSGTVSVTAPVKKTNTSITIPATVKINSYTFKVTAIASSAFKSNTKLKKVTIGTNVTTIGKQAFYGCKVLTTINVNTKVLKSVGANALKGIYAKATIKVPSAKLTAYKKLLAGKGQSSTVKITK